MSAVKAAAKVGLVFWLMGLSEPTRRLRAAIFQGSPMIGR